MPNIIRFPEPGSARVPMTRDADSGEHCAEILFFTGVRYSRSDNRQVSQSLHLRGKEKIEA